ncbi:MAG: NTP/NDP exchange transporter [Planctomycetota bacterium]
MQDPAPAAGSTHEIRAALWLGCVLAAYSLLKPVRDAMAVAGHVDQIRWLWNGTFFVTLLTAPLFALAAARFPRGRLIVIAYAAVSACLAAAWLAWQSGDSDLRLWVGRVFYVFLSVINLFLVSVFWSAITDSLSTSTAIRSFGRIAVGGTLGAVAGSESARQLSQTLGAHNLLLVAIALLWLGVWAGASFLRRRAGDPLALQLPRGRDAWRDLGAILRVPMLRGLTIYVLLMTYPLAVLYFERTRLVADQAVGLDARTELFATLEVWTQVLTALLQALVVGPLLRRFGLSLALMVLPLIWLVAASGLGALALAGTSTLLLYAIANAVLDATRHAVQKPSREVLFTLAEPHQRFAAKNAIDTLVHRGGDVASAFLHHALARALPQLGHVLLTVAPIAAVWTLVGWRLGRAAKSPAASSATA